MVERMVCLCSVGPANRVSHRAVLKGLKSAGSLIGQTLPFGGPNTKNVCPLFITPWEWPGTDRSWLQRSLWGTLSGCCSVQWCCHPCWRKSWKINRQITDSCLVGGNMSCKLPVVFCCLADSFCSHETKEWEAYNSLNTADNYSGQTPFPIGKPVFTVSKALLIIKRTACSRYPEGRDWLKTLSGMRYNLLGSPFKPQGKLNFSQSY